MKINKVTITGADNKVTPQSLVSITNKYPFVEWGILFSLSKEGFQRYPTKAWIEELVKEDLELSAHFCGWWAKQVLEEGNFKLISNLNPKFKRVQLNYNFQNSRGWNLEKLNDYAMDNPERKIILQYNKSNAETLLDFINSGIFLNFDFLYDSSGGRGTEIKEIGDPIRNHYTGYSGGISPTTIDDVCLQILRHNSPAEVWVDLESGARTYNEFDFDKVDEILKKSSYFVKTL